MQVAMAAYACGVRKACPARGERNKRRPLRDTTLEALIYSIVFSAYCMRARGQKSVSRVR